jgi:hypothetical protein
LIEAIHILVFCDSPIQGEAMNQLEEFINKQAELRFKEIEKESKQTGKSVLEIARQKGFKIDSENPSIVQQWKDSTDITERAIANGILKTGEANDMHEHAHTTLIYKREGDNND